ncbi:MAG: hypothetical protein RBR16_13500 [Syntrophus sp. (in: bacteria)]|nr:hypothetical protein [Syntrophus sp. (in: bacteria)]
MEKAAYVIAQSAEALIRAMGMFIHDLWQLKNGTDSVYTEQSYENLIHDHGLDHNSLISRLHD